MLTKLIHVLRMFTQIDDDYNIHVHSFVVHEFINKILTNLLCIYSLSKTGIHFDYKHSNLQRN